MAFPEKLKKIIKCECGVPLCKRVDFSRFEIRRNLTGESCNMPIIIPEKNGASFQIKCPKCGSGMTYCFAVETIKVSDDCTVFGED